MAFTVPSQMASAVAASSASVRRFWAKRPLEMRAKQMKQTRVFIIELSLAISRLLVVPKLSAQNKG